MHDRLHQDEQGTPPCADDDRKLTKGDEKLMAWVEWGEVTVSGKTWGHEANSASRRREYGTVYTTSGLET